MANLEDARHNAAQEAENIRHNRAMETETARSNLANEAIGRSNAKTNAKNATTNRMQYRRQVKDSKVERLNTKARTQNTKRATQHYDVEEAQGWTDLELKKIQTMTEARYKDQMADINREKNQVQRERNYNDLLVSAAKDPKLWAYLVATGKIPAKEVKKAKDNVTKAVNDAVDKGVQGANAIWYSYIRPAVSEVNPHIAQFLDTVMSVITHKPIRIKSGTTTHKTKSGKKAGGKGGKF